MSIDYAPTGYLLSVRELQPLLPTLALLGKLVLVLDADRTLVPHSGIELPEWWEEFRAEARRCGFVIIIASNSPVARKHWEDIENGVYLFNPPSRIQFLFWLLTLKLKPFTRFLEGALKLPEQEFLPEQVVVVGEDFLRDIIPAKKLNIETAYLVKPVGEKEFSLDAKLNRQGRLERAMAKHGGPWLAMSTSQETPRD